MNADSRLKSLAARIEKLMGERDDINSDIRDVFTEAKSHGYVPKVLRKAITRKRMDPEKRDEEDAILNLYEDALGPVGKAVAAVRAGTTWKEAAGTHGVPRATLARAVKSQKLQTDTAARSPTQAYIDSFAETAPDVPGESAATGFATGNSAHEGERDGQLRSGNGGAGGQREAICGASAGGTVDGDGIAVGGAGREPRPAAEHAGADRGAAGSLLATADADQRHQGGDAAGADARHAGLTALHGGDDGPGTQPAGCDLHAPSGTAVAGAGRGVDAPSTPPITSDEQEAWHAKCAGYAADDEAEFQASLGAVGSDSDRVARPTSNPDHLQALKAAEGWDTRPVEDDLPVPALFDRRQQTRT